MQPVSPTVFSLTYDAAAHILQGRWLHETTEANLYPTYERLLAAAKAHDNSRFWLLDIRQTGQQPAGFDRWLTDLLAQQVVRELGSPVFVAYVASASLRETIESAATASMLRQVAQVEFYPYFFDNEEGARDWLRYYQAHPSQQPATHQR